jgi:hypothetical protein
MRAKPGHVLANPAGWRRGMHRHSLRGATAILCCAAVACLLVTGCGTARDPGSAGGAATGRLTAATQREKGRAIALAARLLDRLRLPARTRQVRPGRIPALLRRPAQGIGGLLSVDAHRFYASPQSAAAVARYLNAHVPAGERLEVSGQSPDQFVAYYLIRLPRGMDTAAAVVAVVPGPHHGSLLRADGQVAWYPARSAAERLTPSAFRAVQVTRRLLGPGRTTSRRVTSRAVIARLARLIDRLPTAPAGAWSCARISGYDTLAFRPATRRQVPVLVTVDVCPFITVKAGGRTQPALASSARLAALTRQLLQHR